MLTCHWMKCTLAFQVLEVEVTPMSHRKSSQGMVLKYEVSHAGLFLQTEVISYLDVQEVVIVDTIPEVCSASTNPIIDALRSQTNSNQDHRVLKFQRNGFFPFPFPFAWLKLKFGSKLWLKFSSSSSITKFTPKSAKLIALRQYEATCRS